MVETCALKIGPEGWSHEEEAPLKERGKSLMAPGPLGEEYQETALQFANGRLAMRKEEGVAANSVSLRMGL